MTRARSAVVAALLLAGALLAAPAVAHADDANDNDVTVTVPVVPSNAPPVDDDIPAGSIPPVKPPAPGTGGGGTGGGTTPTGTGAGTPTTETPATASVCTPAEPPMPTGAATSGDEASVDKDVYRAGEDVTATASGFAAGEQVQLVMFSEPTLVGSFTADDTGTVRAVFPVSDEALPGTHALQFTGWCEGVAIADVLIGSGAIDTGSAASGIPVWAWWVAGALGVLVIAVGGWYVVRVMRAPAASGAVA